MQGGAFKSDAVLRAFELVCGVETVRPDIAHLMGAYGAALIARERAADALFGGLTELAHAKPPSPLSPSGLLSVAQLEALDPVRRTIRCPGCANACTLALVSFGEERLFISGNRCSRAESFVDARGRALDPGEVENIRERDGRSSGPEDADAHDGCLLDLGDGRLPDSRDVVAHRSSAPPNVVACEQRLLARFRNEVSAGPRGACAVGLLTVLNSYENLPFWHTFFRELGFSVLVPQPWVGDVPVRAGRSEIGRAHV